ncbi:MAG: efflux RND transporter periplasmic adaptor subunit [Chloroflexota bacterium]
MDRIQSITKNKKIALLVGVVAFLAATLAFALPGVSAQAGYETEPLRRGDLTMTVSASGAARAHQSASLAWETIGVVETVNAQAGESVTAGETLAALAQDSLPRSVALAEADLVAAQQALDDLLGSANTDKANAAIALREAQEAYEDAVAYREALDHEVRYDLLNFIQRPDGKVKVRGFSHVSYMPSEEQKAEADEDVALQKAKMEDAQRAYERVANGPNPQDVAAVEARVLAAQAVLDQARIIAPFDGVITDALPQPGDRVSPGQAAFQVHNLSTLLVDLDVSEMDINRVALHQKVTLRFEAIPGKEYRGEVVEIAGSGQRSAGGVNFRVTLELSDADGQVRPGMSAEAVIQVRDVQDALLVPNRAIRMLDGQRVVYALREDGPLEAIPVRLGVTSDAYSELAAGALQEGNQIVLNPPAVEK